MYQDFPRMVARSGFNRHLNFLIIDREISEYRVHSRIYNAVGCTLKLLNVSLLYPILVRNVLVAQEICKLTTTLRPCTTAIDTKDEGLT